MKFDGDSRTIREQIVTVYLPANVAESDVEVVKVIVLPPNGKGRQLTFRSTDFQESWK